ncbi:WbqC family protein [Lewinella sp. 4G2]|uniref:WbqC family protein n=1 Tax=Lewinella sp. 4G2 TaxID=1803372 RepID=UPI0007B45EE4|nr:WbqC family protein [Lewinella sp. 4G2]OAV45243.1 hypothetical protein A3850_012390 [Lewinella sp. 4G2]
MPLITPTAYFPPAHWFVAAAKAGEWQLEAHENYQRKGFRNRAQIAGPNGLLYLSVPLQKGKNQRMPIREVSVGTEDDWRREHVASIRAAYGRAPFYEYYADPILQAITAASDNLFELNYELIQLIIDGLGMNIKLHKTANFQALPRTQNLPRLAPYQQVFTDRHGFRSDLSILDALFCLGPSLTTHPTLIQDTNDMHEGAAAGAVQGPNKTNLTPRTTS